jgi:hypothetical protein
MLLKKLKNCLWPKIVDISTANSAARQGLYRIGFAIISIVGIIFCWDTSYKDTTICNLIYFLPMSLWETSITWELFPGYSIIPLLLALLVGIGIFYQFRLAAVLLLLVELNCVLPFIIAIEFLIRDITMTSQILFNGSHIIIQSLFFLMCINCMRGIFAYHKYKKTQAHTDNIGMQ